MKKISVVVLAFAMLMVFAAVPVMAKTEKVPATAVAVPYYHGAGKEWTTNGGILQGREEIDDYLLLSLDIGGTVHTGVSNNVVLVMGNLKTGMFIVHYDGVWLLDGSTDDGFAGSALAKFWYSDPVTVEWYTFHMVFQGFGAYKGQTLVFSYEGPLVIPIVWEGYCLKG